MKTILDIGSFWFIVTALLGILFYGTYIDPTAPWNSLGKPPNITYRIVPPAIRKTRKLPKTSIAVEMTLLMSSLGDPFSEFLNHAAPPPEPKLPSALTENCDIMPGSMTKSGKNFETQVIEQNPWNRPWRRCQDAI